ncbi:MAG: hypothetical protein M3495_06005 [Pseudomonadota bacterium]|nr:hypothetical protein [Gammaproteobacteria bacterium]MDQ3581174.1 hypothetical protein [Pseudomonadota bacterium]
MNKACSILFASIAVAPSADARGPYETEVRAIFDNIEKHNNVVIECQTLVDSDVAVMFESGFKSRHIVIDPALVRATRDKRTCERRVAFVNSSSASRKDKAAVLLGLIYVGMREAAALASWGRPKSTNKYDSGKTQQWVYDNKVSPTMYYIYLENGVVSSWQSREGS